MKNFMTIFSIVLIFVFAITTIRCDDEKNDTENGNGDTPTTGLKINVPLDFKTGDVINSAYTGNRLMPELTVTGIEPQDIRTYFAIVKVDVGKGQDSYTADRVYLGDIAPKQTELKLSLHSWGINPSVGETRLYQFHLLHLKPYYTPIYLVATDNTFEKAWTKVQDTQKNLNDNTTNILAYAKNIAYGQASKQ